MSISNFFAQNTAVSFLKTASAAAQAINQSHKKQKDSDPMVAALSDNSSDKAKAFNDEQNELKQTLQQLQSSKTGNSEQRNKNNNGYYKKRRQQQESQNSHPQNNFRQQSKAYQ